MPLLSAPTGLSRSWHRREQSRLANSWDFMVVYAPVSAVLVPYWNVALVLATASIDVELDRLERA